MKEQKTSKENFRDHIATVDEQGKRRWVYPRKPRGRYHQARVVVAVLLLGLLFGMPFIEIGGLPMIQFNLLERKFILLGVLFRPQDFHLFALAMITLMIFVGLFTVVFGRLFCGWICPQTIFMEMVFRKIEYWIEGNANAQKRLDKQPWGLEKIGKKGLKHGLFFAIAVLIANTFLSYIIGVDQVWAIVREPIHMHRGGFLSMLFFSFLFYGVFAYMREQVCIAVCPYGRLQGVLTDADTILVAYDYVRGEPRGKIKRKKNRPLKKIQEQVAMASCEAGSAATDAQMAAEESPIKIVGDCVDCNLCVQVCPTGIDIRNGTQMECVNCTACIDACDGVMDKIKKPRGLIRYASENNIRKEQAFRLTRRAKAYSVVLLILIGLQSFLLFGRSDVETTLLRTPGLLYQKVDETYLSNLYNYQIVNKTNQVIEEVEIRCTTEGTRVRLVGELDGVPAQGIKEGAIFIDYDQSKLKGRKNPVRLQVFAGGELIDEVKTNFLGPVK
ncbi:MAG: 4Fe-4S dicluster domain-containing protein [Bacteroidota bacterium]